MGKVAAGGDPAAERAARAAEPAGRKAEAARIASEAAFTLDALLTDWTALHLSTRRPRYAAEATRALRAAFGGHLQAPATALDHVGVLGVVDSLAKAGKATTAALTMRYGSACYGWAVKRRRVTLNPFAGLPMPERPGSRERVVSADEIGEIWRAAGTLDPPYGPMVRLLLLTLVRRDEVCGMTWGEVASDLSTWTQPAGRTKNGRAHLVHLSAPARALLRERLDMTRSRPMPAADALVFGSMTAGTVRPISGHSWVKRELNKAIATARAKAAAEIGTEGEPMPSWVPHDFRRAGVIWLAGAGFPPLISDRLLNHSTGTISSVMTTYQRAEFLIERAGALDTWPDYVVTTGEGRTDQGKVMKLTRRPTRA